MKAQMGIATALIRAGNSPGEIHIRAASKGYTPAEVSFESKAPKMPAVAGQGVASGAARPRATARVAAQPAKPVPAAPAEIQKLNAEIKRLQQELTVKEQTNQELLLKLNEKR
jgi:hypothetical protein